MKIPLIDRTCRESEQCPYDDADHYLLQEQWGREHVTYGVQRVNTMNTTICEVEWPRGKQVCTLTRIGLLWHVALKLGTTSSAPITSS